MKKTLTLLSVVLIPLLSSAQRNFYRLSAGIGGGMTQNQGDLNSPKPQSLVLGTLDYHFSPYIYSGLEVQAGRIAGTETERYGRQYQNNFITTLFLTKIHAGQFIRRRGFATGTEAIVLNTIKGIYAGSGIGLIANNQKKIFRDQNNYLTSGSSQNIEGVLPLTIGIDNSAFYSRYIIGLGYQAHFAMGDQLDGYSTRGSNTDFYSTLVLTLRMKFGPYGIY